MKYIIYIATVAVITVLLHACGKNDSDRLSAAIQVLDERPDSAYMLLKDIDYNSLDEKDKADFALTRARANMYMGRSLITDTLLNQSINYFKSACDTISYVDAVIVQAKHLRSLENINEANNLIEQMSTEMPDDIKKTLNLELFHFSIKDKNYIKSLEITEHLIKLADSDNERLIHETKKIVPLLSLGRSKEAISLLDSLFKSPSAPPVGSDAWIYMRIHYANALSEQSETAKQACEIMKDAIDRMEGAPDSKLVEFYLPMVNLQLNAGNTKEAERYLKIIEKHGTDFISSDPVAAYYLELLKIASDYQKTGVLSVYKIANTALLLRNVSNNLETKKKERNLAFEEAYDLSKDNYELTIKQQRMWLTIIIITLSSFIIIMFLWYMSHRRRTRLIEAEERIDTLEGLLKSANNPATDQKQRLLKKLLLQQLGIIRTFAESPTAQNQEALRKISNIGNSDTPLDTLVKWDDLYPVIDELYENFHDNLLKRYPQLFSQREVQIICLIRAGFSTKEIGVLIQQSSNSIYVSKTAIRKKLGVQPKEDFMEALTSSLTNLQKA
ncbi:MAG: LuxR C-terminal-related transcriptional regulator [Muribaculaceae bacterium]|nr:LuxR C-terminal-related transcriptional regulator [Muribaculaceae bacterium]